MKTVAKLKKEVVTGTVTLELTPYEYCLLVAIAANIVGAGKARNVTDEIYNQAQNRFSTNIDNLTLDDRQPRIDLGIDNFESTANKLMDFLSV